MTSTARSRTQFMLFDLYGPAPMTPTDVTSGLHTVPMHEGNKVRLVASGVRGRIESKSDVITPYTGVGGSPVDQMDTTDHLRLNGTLRDGDGNTIRPGHGWFVKITGNGLDETGSWYAVLGEPQWRFRHSVQIFLVTRCNRPPIDD